MKKSIHSCTVLLNQKNLKSLIPVQKVGGKPFEMKFMEQLFPKGVQVVIPEPDLPSVISTHRAQSQSKLTEKISGIYAAMEAGDLQRAEKWFHITYRTQSHLNSLLDLKIMNRFIELYLEKARQVKDKGFEQQAIEWFDAIRNDYGMEPNYHSFALLLTWFLENRNWTMVETYLQKMEQAGLELEKLIQDTCFQSNTMLELLNAFLQSINRPTIQKIPNVHDLLISALQDTYADMQEDVKMDEKELLEDLIPTKTDGVEILRNTLKGKLQSSQMTKYNQQLWLESRAYAAAQDHYEALQKKMPEQVRNRTTLPHDITQTWHNALQSEIEIELGKEPTKDELTFIPFLKLLSPNVISRITITEILRVPALKDQHSNTVSSFGQVSALHLALNIANALQREHNLEQMNSKKNVRKLNLQKSVHKIHSTGKLFNITLRKAITELARNENQSSSWKPDWGVRVSTLVGSFLLNLAVKVAMLPIQEQISTNSKEFVKKQVPALEHGVFWKDGKSVGVIKIHPALYDLMANTTHNVEPWSLPMLVPPLPWLTSFSGGYLQHRFPLVRTNRNEEHNEYIKAADEANHLTTIMRALDVLGATAWTINKNVYKTAAYFWNKKINLPGLPSDEPLPEIEKPLDLETNIKSQAWYKNECRKRKQKISNAFSERCNANYKLDIARSFLDEIIYFPHNVDFRGRAYPLPPHLNHMGDDLCRGLLLFQEKKKLGQRGLFWLQVHVSNLFGFDKASLQERVEFTKSHVNDIIDSAENPIHGKQWWLQGDKPWQLLAACFELNQAMKLEDPSEYECNLAIHQDGSCNGLQHYAALGGDVAGAEAVNLVPSDKPGDVYSGVARRVQEKVNLDVENGIPEALLMQHRINRKLVKQTVMTNTYGVTRIGARDQIQSRLREARVHEAVETRLSDEQIRKCAGYITTKVFESMTDMFQGARAIQIWLNTAARLVTSSVPSNRISKQDKLLYDTMVEFGILTKPETNSKKPQSDLVADSILAAVEQDLQNQDLEKNEEDDDDTLDEKEYITLAKKSPLKVTSMTWTSPLGFPIVQPYRKASVTQVKTFMQTFTIHEQSQTSPVNSMKQSSAFPPNFVHSLDASHMMLTCVTCAANNITFASVHDSYWTHAGDVDEMSRILREAFVRLHSKNIMERLRDELMARFGDHRLLIKVDVTNENKAQFDKVNKKLKTKKYSRKQVQVWVPFELPALPERGSFQVSQEVVGAKSEQVGNTMFVKVPPKSKKKAKPKKPIKPQLEVLKKDDIWELGDEKERERIREFWMNLGEQERQALVKLDKDTVLKKMKEQQKQTCSCAVCGKKRSTIENQLELLYNTYCEELEAFERDQMNSKDAFPIHPHSFHTYRDIPPLIEDDDVSELEDMHDETVEEEDLESESDSDESGIVEFGTSLTVKGGVLTVADDFLKNDGRRFLELMEQLSQDHDNPDEYENESSDDDEGMMPNAPPYNDEEYEHFTDIQRREEGRRMFQVFAAKMFEQRLLNAYREKAAEVRAAQLFAELEAEEQNQKQKKVAKQKKQEKEKLRQKLLKEKQENEKLAADQRKKQEKEEKARKKQEELIQKEREKEAARLAELAEQEAKERQKLRKEEEQRQRAEKLRKENELRLEKEKEEEKRKKEAADKKRENDERKKKERRDRKQKELEAKRLVEEELIRKELEEKMRQEEKKHMEEIEQEKARLAIERKELERERAIQEQRLLELEMERSRLKAEESMQLYPSDSLPISNYQSPIPGLSNEMPTKFGSNSSSPLFKSQTPYFDVYSPNALTPSVRRFFENIPSNSNVDSRGFPLPSTVPRNQSNTSRLGIPLQPEEPITQASNLNSNWNMSLANGMEPPGFSRRKQFDDWSHQQPQQSRYSPNEPTLNSIGSRSNDPFFMNFDDQKNDRMYAANDNSLPPGLGYRKTSPSNAFDNPAQSFSTHLPPGLSNRNAFQDSNNDLFNLPNSSNDASYKWEESSDRLIQNRTPLNSNGLHGSRFFSSSAMNDSIQFNQQQKSFRRNDTANRNNHQNFGDSFGQFR